MTQPTDPDKILAALCGDGRLDIGASTPVDAHATDTDELQRLARSSSAPVTFVDIDIPGDEPAGGDDDGLAQIDGLLERLERFITDETPFKLRITGYDNGIYTLEPLDEWMRHPRLSYTGGKNLEQMYGPSLAPGEVLTAHMLPFVIPSVRMRFHVHDSAKADSADAGHQAGHSKAEIDELKAQPAGTYIQVTAGNKIPNTIPDQESKITEVRRNGRFLCRTAKDILTNPLPDGSYVVAPTTTSKGYLTVENSCGRTIDLPYSPSLPGRYISDTDPSKSLVTGTVHYIFPAGRQLLDVIFTEPGGERWRSGVFRLKYDGTETLPFPVRDAARQYIRVGYPCTLRVVFNPERPEQSKLLLTGLSSVLIGRVGPTIDTRRLVAGTPLPERHLAPAAVIGDDIMMVDAGYTAFMPKFAAPRGLRMMVEAGVFSANLTIACRMKLKEVSTAEGRRFKLTCSPLEPKYGERYALGAPVDNVRVCCSVGERLVMMAGNSPALTEPLPDDTRLALLRDLTKAQWTVAECRPDGWLVLRCSDLDLDTSAIVTSGLSIGGLFELGRDDTYRDRPVVAVPRGRHPRPGTMMMALVVDGRSGAIIATDELTHFTDRAWIGEQRMKAITDLLDYNVLLLEDPDGKLNACQVFNETALLILRRLKALYGDKTTVLARRESGARLVSAMMTGVICQHDYSALLSGDIPSEVAALWEGLDDDTPLLYGDIALTRRELPGLPAATPGADASRSNASDGVPGWEVMKYDRREDTLSFWTGTTAVQHVDRAALRLPVATTTIQRMTQKPLTELLPLQSKWRIERDSAGNVRIHAHTDNIARPYTLVSRLNDSEWVVRSDDGSIALTRDAGDAARSGDRVMMAYSGEIGPVVYVARKDEILIGMKLRLQVTEIADGVAVCRDMAGNIRRRIELPLGNVSWNEDWTPRQLAAGTVLTAVVVDEEPGLLVVDRRLLLHQNALYPGVRPQPSATYQMEVVGVVSDGYRLSQNGVEILLPFEKAAVCEINIFNENYLRPGDLVAVKIDADGYTADWRPTRARAIAELATAGDSLMTFSVHHFSPDGIFVMRRGVMMFLPNNQVGHWAGRPLDDIFAPGTLLQLVVERTDSGTLEARALNPLPFVQTAPEIGGLLAGRISYVYPSMGCYVDCGIDLPPVYVEASDFAKAGIAMEPGTDVDIQVNAVLDEDGIVMGHLPGTISEPVAKPLTVENARESVATEIADAIAGMAEHAADCEIRVFKSILQATDGAAELVAADGSHAIFIPGTAMTLDRLHGYLDWGRGALAITGRRPDGTAEAAYDPLIQAHGELMLELKLTPASPLPRRGRIIGFTDNRGLILQAGMNILTIAPKKLRARPTQEAYATLYSLGTEVDVWVYSASSGLTFSATDIPPTDLPPIDSPQ